MKVIVVNEDIVLVRHWLRWQLWGSINGANAWSSKRLKNIFTMADEEYDD